MKTVSSAKSQVGKIYLAFEQSPSTSNETLVWRPKKNNRKVAFIFVCTSFSYRINFFLATFTNSDVTDMNKWRDSLEDSFRDIRNLLLTSKL